jgi:hypothetical protein
MHQPIKTLVFLSIFQVFFFFFFSPTPFCSTLKKNKSMSSTSSQIITDEPARLGKTSATLFYFCVYNPSLGPTEETAKDQILYYTAKKVVPADIKMKQVGLAQALVNFTRFGLLFIIKEKNAHFVKTAPSLNNQYKMFIPKRIAWCSCKRNPGFGCICVWSWVFCENKSRIQKEKKNW